MNKFNTFLEEKGIKSEDFSAMDAEKQAELYNEFNEAKRKEIEEAIESKATKEDIADLKAELQSTMTDQMKSLNQALKDQGLAIKKLSQSEKAERAASFESEVKAGLAENLEKLKSLKSSKSGEFKFDVKAAGSITSSNISGGNVPVEDRIEGLNTVASRQVRFLDLLNRQSTESNIVSWVYQANKDGAAGQTAEASAKNQIDFDLVVNSESIKKTTAYIKVSTEMLDDVSWIESEINSELRRELLKAVESGAYEGDGLSNNLNGVRTVANQFSPTPTFAAKVDNANAVDVLVAALDQIEKEDHEMVRPAIFMNPSDVNFLKATKVSSTDKRYVERLVMVGSTLMLDGYVPIIKSTAVTIDQYLVGDFSKAYLVEKGGLSIEVGLDGNDWTENMRTIIAEWRGLVYVKDNDRTAFVAGDFTTDTAALETP